MIQFLFNSYGNITPLQLDANDKMMKEQWDPLTPIIYLFAKIQEGVDKADTGNAPYTVNQVLAIAFNHVFQTGTMQNAYEWWTSLNQTHKTWTHLCSPNRMKPMNPSQLRREGIMAPTTYTAWHQRHSRNPSTPKQQMHLSTSRWWQRPTKTFYLH
jgi:hypothetical protein